MNPTAIIIYILVTVIAALSVVLYLKHLKESRQTRLIKEIDMSILEITIPGCKDIYFYMHPDRKRVKRCSVGVPYNIKELVPDMTDKIIISVNGQTFVMNDMEECFIEITDIQVMPSGDPMMQGQLLP